MTWYLVQYSGQWGFVRRPRPRDGRAGDGGISRRAGGRAGHPDPLPQATPEPLGPDATSAYAKLIKDAVNLRRTPSASGTSMGRIPVNTLLLVTGTEYDGTYTWYQVNYSGMDGWCPQRHVPDADHRGAPEVSRRGRAGHACPERRDRHPEQEQQHNRDHQRHAASGSAADRQQLVERHGHGMPNYATTAPNTTPTPEPGFQPGNHY